MNRKRLGAALLAAGLLLTQAVQAAETLPVFNIAAITNADPSAWTVQYMKEKQLDRQYGFDLQYRLKPVSVAYSEFINGTDPVCLCLTIGTAAKFLQKGADVSLISTYNNYDNAYVVTENPAIQRPGDLVGHTLAGSTGSGSWVFHQYFLKEQQQVDLTKVSIPSIVSSAQIPNLLAQRVDAIPGFDDTRLRLQEAQPGRFRFIPTFDKRKWQQVTGVDFIPMFFLGARGSWLSQPENRALLAKFSRAYDAALKAIKADPQAAAQLLGQQRIFASPAYLTTFFSTLKQADAVVPASQLRPAITALTQQLLPAAGLLDRPLSAGEIDALIAPPLN